MSFFRFTTKSKPLTSHRIILLGRGESGKTSILSRSAPDECCQISAMGFNGHVYAETINFGENLHPLEVWDLKGAPPLMQLWHHFVNFRNTRGLIYVVDGTNFQEVEDRRLLWNIFEPNDLRGLPILLFVNKRDLPQYGNVTEIVDGLNMHAFQNRLWHVQSCSAVTGEGIREGFMELHQMIRHLTES